MVHYETINKCGDSDLPRWVERLRGQIKEREGVGKERVSSVVLLGKK